MAETSFHLYEAEVEWLKEREGTLRSAGLPEIKFSSPPEFKGIEGAWTPEHLYVASVNSCFMLTFLAIAEASKLELSSFESTARGTLEKSKDQGYLISEIVIQPKIMLRNQSDRERAGRLLEKAEKNCFIANSIKTVVKLESEIGY